MFVICDDFVMVEECLLNLVDLYDVVVVLFGQVLYKMDFVQQEEFFCVYGMNFIKLVWCVGCDCCQVFEELVVDGMLSLFVGEVLCVDVCVFGQLFVIMIY